jgi:hypothetical protein
MVVIQNSVEGVEKAVNIFQGIASQVDDNMDVAWARVHRLLVAIEAKQFAYGGTRGPNPWAPLSPNTIARKRRMGLRLKKMHATEETANSLRTLNNPLHIWRVHPGSDPYAEFGSEAQGFKVHQFDDSGNHFPFRPPVDLTEMDVNKVTKIFHAHIMSGAATRQGRLIGPTAEIG